MDKIWSMFFSGVVALQYHPRNEPQSRMSLEECARVADRMLEEYISRKPVFDKLEVIWRG